MLNTFKIPRRGNFQANSFGLNLRKLPNYVRYFCYYNLESVAGSLVEISKINWVKDDGARWRWMELGGCAYTV